MKKEKWMIFDRVFLILGLVLVLISILPLFYRIMHVGVWLPMLAGVVLIGYGALNQRLLAWLPWWQAVSRIFVVCVCIGLAAFVVLSGVLFFGFDRYIGNGNSETVVVLGCQIRGDRPSKMLGHRLDTAAGILNKQPDSMCIVSGGQGSDEDYSEAEIMKKVLIEHGIAENRILLEEQSTNTQENILYSSKLIKQEHLQTDIILVTDFYHQYRSNYLAQKQGLHSQGASCYTNPALVFSYWVREMLAAVKTYITA